MIFSERGATEETVSHIKPYHKLILEVIFNELEAKNTKKNNVKTEKKMYFKMQNKTKIIDLKQFSELYKNPWTLRKNDEISSYDLVPENQF